MGVTNNFNLTGGSTSPNAILTQSLINQSPNILLNASPTPNFSPVNNIINQSPNILLSGTGIGNSLNSFNQFAQNAQSWLNSFESNNNLQVTYPNGTAGNSVSGTLSGLSQLVNSVGGILNMQKGVATGYANPYISGQPSTYSRTTGQAINPLTGQPISSSPFPTTSLLLIGGGLLAVIVLVKMIG